LDGGTAVTQIYRLIIPMCWGLGLVSMLAGVIIKLAHLSATVTIAPHTGFVVASAFFLCAIATREMQRA